VAIEAIGETTIARPIEDVFDYVADPRNEPSWLPGAKSVEKVDDGPVGVGAVFVGQYAGAGRVEVEIVALDRPHRVTHRGRSRLLDFDDAVELTETAGGTHLRATMISTPKGALRLAAPFMAGTTRRRFASNWDHLRRALEGE